jgi:hypothetical protein
MLRITLESQNQINQYTPSKKEEWPFELRVITEGLFPEVRVSFASSIDRKKSKTDQEQNYSGPKENLFR